MKVEYREFGSGISLKLLQLAEEKAKRGAEAIKKLSPGALGVRDLLKKVGADAALSLLGKIVYEISAAGFAAVTSAVLALVNGVDLPSTVREITKSLSPLAKRLGIEYVGESVKGLAERLLEFASKKGDIRNDFLKSLGELLRAVIEAKKYIDDENFEGVVDEVAAQWGLDVDAFKNFVENMYRVATAKLVTEEELNKLRELSDEEFKKRIEELINQRLEPFRKEIEGRLDKIEGALVRLRKRVRNLEKKTQQLGVLLGVYKKPEDLGVYLDAGEFEVPGARYKLVRSGKFDAYAEEILRNLRPGAIVVVTGPKGIGKSVLATYALARALREYTISGEPLYLVYEVDRLADKESLRKASDLVDLSFGYVPVFFYDVYGVLEYEGFKITGHFDYVSSTLHNLTRLVSMSKAAALVVISKDLWDAVYKPEESAGAVRVIEVDLREREFLAGIIGSYSGCDIDVTPLAEELAKFDEGHALLAKLVGEELGEKKCRVEEELELLKRAGGEALTYILSYANRVLRAGNGVVNPVRVTALSKLLRLRSPHALFSPPGTPLLPRGLLKKWYEWEGLDYTEEEIGWLSRRQHDLIETALFMAAAVGATKKSPASERLKEALEPWERHGVGKPYGLEYFLAEYGERLVKELGRKCWRRYALMLGTALAGLPFEPLVEAVREDKERGKDPFGGLLEAVEPCAIDKYLLEEGELTPITWAMLQIREIDGKSLSKAYVEGHNEIADELNRLKEKWRERGWVDPAEAFYGLGLATLLADAKRAGVNVGREAAADALHAASAAVQGISHPVATSGIIEALRPLRDLAPEEWAQILFAASQMGDIDSVMLREELDAIYSSMGAGARDWVKAMVAIAYASLDPPDEENACALMGQIVDETLKLIAKAHAYQALVTRGVFCSGAGAVEVLVNVIKQAEEELEGIVKQLDEALEKAEGGSFVITEELGEYLTRISPEKPEEALRLILLEAKGFALYTLARLKLERDDPKGAADLFENVAKISKELEDWKNYLIAKSKGVWARFLAGELDVGGLVEAFRGLWGEALEHIELGALYLKAAASRMGEYLVALALNGELEEAGGLYREHSWWPRSSPIYANVTTRLLASLLGLKTVEAPSEEEVLLATISYVYRPLLPAYALLFGEDIGDAADICAETSDSELCIEAYLAVRGNKSAIERIELEARNLAIRLGISAGELEGLDAKELVQWMAPIASLAHFILMLRELLRGNYRLARLHALGASKSFKGLPSRLFAEAAEAIERGDEKSLRISLAKLYYFHF